METMLSTTRDREAAKTFFACALKTVGQALEKAPTDGHDSYPRALRETLGPDVSHGASRSMNNRIEQDHRGIKQRYSPLRRGRAWSTPAYRRLPHQWVLKSDASQANAWTWAYTTSSAFASR